MTDLDRFVHAQESTYSRALAELQAGRKQSHWMWFIFPQLRGLGTSEMAHAYGIADASEARAYLAHPILGPRLEACAEALLAHAPRSARDILGPPDDLKLRSCATLFAAVAPERTVFQRLLDAFFDGRPDERTLEMLREGA